MSRLFQSAIAALLELSIPEAAARIKVSESTLRRWLQDPSFQGAYQQARRHVLDDALTALCAARLKAVQTLVKLLDGPPSAAAKAASVLLEHSERAGERFELLERLEKLEAALPLGDGDERPRGRPPKDAAARLDRLESRALCEREPDDDLQALLRSIRPEADAHGSARPTVAPTGPSR